MGWLTFTAGSHNTVQAQTPPPPLPAAWQAIGISTWPTLSPQLGLEFDEIVFPGKVAVHLRSELQFTKKMMLFAQAVDAPDTMVRAASFALSPSLAPDVTFAITAYTTQNLFFLAQTTAGWFMVERQLKVGQKPKP